MKNRRQFLAASAAAVAASALTGPFARAAASGRAAKPMKLLILGGTRFIGLHMTQLALDRGHSVVFFNRGKTKSDRFPKIERIIGDRNDELNGLRGRQFDAVIDNSGYVPRHVRLSADLLAPQVPHYVFVSTVSVYPDFKTPCGEDHVVGKLADETVEKVDGDTYGPLKALCEQAVRKAYPQRATILRPGLIVGPDDNTDRFTYWPARAARGGEFIAPGTPKDRIQFIDARDLAALTLRCVEQRHYGTMNVVTPPGRVTMGGLVDACVAAAKRAVRSGAEPRPVWLPASFLAEQKVAPWSDMPVWLPAEGDEAAFAETPIDRATAAGLMCRSVADTVRDTLAWQLSRPADERGTLKAGIAAARETEVLAAWRAKR